MNNKYIVFTAMGFELIGIILASLYLGKYLDQAMGLSGLGMVILSMAGLAGWIFHLIVLVKKAEESTKDDETAP